MVTQKKKVNMNLCTASGCYKFACEEKFEILGYAMDLQVTSHDAIEERMQSAKKAFWNDILTYKSKDFPWKVKC